MMINDGILSTQIIDQKAFLGLLIENFTNTKFFINCYIDTPQTNVFSNVF